MSIEIKFVEDIEQMSRLSEFFQMIWANGPEVVPFDIGYAIVHVGGYATLAYQGNQIVGASFGVRGKYQDQDILHSHVTASTVPGVGYSLKQHQFHWAKQNDIAAITWTFDPLVRRNCAFNLAKLGTKAVEYLPNFYGVMTDDINAGDRSDRLFSVWSTNCAGPKSTDEICPNIALANHSGHPQVQEYDPEIPYAIYLPEDIELLRKSNLGLVGIWRSAVHQILQSAFTAGCYIDRMVDDRKALLVTPMKGPK